LSAGKKLIDTSHPAYKAVTADVTAEYVDRISKGDIPPKITDTYQGDFNEIKNNLNASIDVMNGLLREPTEFGQKCAGFGSSKFHSSRVPLCADPYGGLFSAAPASKSTSSRATKPWPWYSQNIPRAAHDS
jgi:hypothetical protein